MDCRQANVDYQAEMEAGKVLDTLRFYGAGGLLKNQSQTIQNYTYNLGNI